MRPSARSGCRRRGPRPAGPRPPSRHPRHPLHLFSTARAPPRAASLPRPPSPLTPRSPGPAPRRGPRPGPETRVARERLRASESVRDSAPGPAWGRAATRRRGHPATNGEVSHLFLVMQTNCKHLFSFLGPGPKKRTQGPYINSCGDPARRAAGGLERQRRRERRARLPMTPGCSFTPAAPAGSRLAAHARPGTGRRLGLPIVAGQCHNHCHSCMRCDLVAFTTVTHRAARAAGPGGPQRHGTRCRLCCA